MEQLKQINFELINNFKCKTCGGIIDKGFTCIYCYHKDDILINEVDKLVNILQENINKDIVLSLDTVDSIIKLLKLRNSNDFIGSFAEKHQLSQKIEEFLHNVIVKFSNGEYATVDEEKLLVELLKEGIYTPRLINVVIFESLVGNQVMRYESFQELIKCSTKAFAIDITNDLNFNRDKYIISKKNFCVIKNQSNEVRGSFDNLFCEIHLEPKTIMEIYSGNQDGLVTIFHELVHLRQEVMIREKYCTPLLLEQIKETVIRDIQCKNMSSDQYYNDNYLYDKREIEARAEASIFFLRYLDVLGLKTPNIIKEKFNQMINEELERNKNNLRNFDGNDEKASIDEIFEMVISDYPNYLLRYPQLKLEYIVEDDKVRPKTRQELINSFMNTDDKVTQTILFKRLKELAPDEEKRPSVK